MNLDDAAAAYRVLALDGCDGVGKTTLADRLVADRGFVRMHSPRTPDRVSLVERYRGILNLDGRLVLDRCFVSELVYGPLYRNNSRLSWQAATDLAALLTVRGGAFVHVTGLSSVIHRRLLGRSEATPSGVEEVDRLLSAYHDVFQRLSRYAHVIEANTTAPDHPIE